MCIVRIIIIRVQRRHMDLPSTIQLAYSTYNKHCPLKQVLNNSGSNILFVVGSNVFISSIDPTGYFYFSALVLSYQLS